MSIQPSEAAAALVDIETIARRVKQSTFYQLGSSAMIGWGVLVALGYCLSYFMPQWVPVSWLAIDAVGMAGTALFVFSLKRKLAQPFDPRVLLAMLLFFAFGVLWSQVLGRFGLREFETFWPSLFMFGYALAGLWLGRAFVATGLAIALLAVIGYLWVTTAFELYLAVVAGGGLMLCGLLMRRA